MSQMPSAFKSGQPPLSALGRFEILAPIGSGGMASIYLARIAGPAGFEKPVALKVIHTHLAEDPEFVTMFFDEARIAAQLHHPNIVQINELGEAAGTYFMAMEYLRGETVGTIVQRIVKRGKGLMDPRMACHIAMEACEGLHHAHEMSDLEGRPLGLVHRDVSPQNLFVTYSGSVKLMDFGIARAAGLAHSTRPGSLKGKFAYMSPEQAKGLDIDRRADVFALGIVMWEVLTGRRLFKGQSDVDSLRRVTDSRIPAILELRSGIPPDLERVMARVLARDVTERYQTAMELHADLGLVADQLGSPVTTHELAKRMGSWFPQEEARKKGLLAKTVPMMQMPPVIAGGGAATDGAVEETPSFSETSGIRRRAMEEGGETTPSGPQQWPPPPGVAEPGPDLSQRGSPPPAEHPPVEGEEPSRSVAWDTRPGRAAIVVGVIVGLIVVGGLIGGGLFFLPRLLARPSSPVAGGAAAEVPGPDLAQPGASGSVGDGPTASGTVPGGDPSTPSSLALPTVDAAPAPSADVVPEAVTLRLEVHPEDATVTVDGTRREDPAAIEIPRSTESVLVEVSAPGHLPERLTVVPDQDQSRTIELRRRRRGGPRPGGRPGSKAPGDLVSNPYAPR